MRASRMTATALLGVPLLLTGCASAEQDAAEDVARSFHDAVRARDGGEACRLAAPETRRELEQSVEKPCAAAILSEHLPSDGDVVDTQRYGQQAEVEFGSDTVFLARFEDGWRVVAAGCTPRPPLPYDCTVKGW